LPLQEKRRKTKYKSKSSHSQGTYKRKRSSSQSSNRSNGAISNKTAKSPAIKSDNYVVTKATSLRALPDSQSGVLKRIAASDQVKAIDCGSNEFWCKVIHNGKKGWVKKHLLEKR